MTKINDYNNPHPMFDEKMKLDEGSATSFNEALSSAEISLNEIGSLWRDCTGPNVNIDINNRLHALREAVTAMIDSFEDSHNWENIEE